MELVIRPVGFLDTTQLCATYTIKYHDRMDAGILELRGADTEDPLNEDPVNRVVLREWRAARALLSRIKAQASILFEGEPAELGRAWLELLPGGHGTPWTIEEDEYAQAHVRTRTRIIAAPDAYCLSGAERNILNTGWVHVVEHRILCSEINLGVFPRLDLIVDVRKPDSP